MVVIAHVQYFVRVNLRANKMKSPTILSAISCFLITITTIYLRWCCMVMKSTQNQCPMIDIWKVLPDFFGEVLAENQRKLSFPSFASFIYVLLRLIICNKLGQWTSFSLAYASKVLVDDAQKLRPTEIFRRHETAENNRKTPFFLGKLYFIAVYRHHIA